AAGQGGVAETIVRVLGLLSSAPARAVRFVPDTLLLKHDVTRASLAARQVSPGVPALGAELRGIGQRHLSAATAASYGLAPEVAAAFLPLAVTSARLDRMARAPTPFASADLSPWRRQWITWRAARRLRKPH